MLRKPVVAMGVCLIALLAPEAPAAQETIAGSYLPGSAQRVEPEWLEAWRSTSAERPAYLNRLTVSDSSFLLQHADNPIDWYPWDEAAFAKSVASNKLIFLSIGYASCHWCHVMEKESFSDPDVAQALNRSFVSIKVDREQLPDVDAHYGLVVETIEGESGWPLTVILLPDRRPVFAPNYLDKERLLTALGRLAEFWQTQPHAMQQNARLLAGEIGRRQQRRVRGQAIPEADWTALATRHLLDDIDHENGGFGRATKFPGEIRLRFLLEQHMQQPSEAVSTALTAQLDALSGKGMSDVVFGGIFRYTTDREMTRPHFEKMLYNRHRPWHGSRKPDAGSKTRGTASSQVTSSNLWTITRICRTVVSQRPSMPTTVVSRVGTTCGTTKTCPICRLHCIGRQLKPEVYSCTGRSAGPPINPGASV